MSDKEKTPMTEAEFATKVDDEGGIFDALMSGLTADDVEPGKLHDLWDRLDSMWAGLQDTVGEVYEMIHGQEWLL